MAIIVTGTIIRTISPKETPSLVPPLVAAMNEFFPAYDITTENRVENFLAQACIESDYFKTLKEYASGKAYEGRDDLGNTEKGDGVRYKGRGIFQLTGRANYTKMTATLRKLGHDVDLVNNPELAAEPRLSVLIACEYWKSRKLNALADADDVRGITKRINGGYNHLADRMAVRERLRALVKATAPATPTDPLIGPDSPRELVKTLQKILDQKSYNPGKADGLWGKLTRAAVLALKADNGLDTTTDSILLSQAKAAPVRVIETRQDATVADLRAEGSSTVKGADTVQIGAGLTGTVGTVGYVAKETGILDQAEGASSTASRWLSIFEPFRDLLPWIMDNWAFFAIGGAAGVAFLAYRAKMKRLEEYKTGKMG